VFFVALQSLYLRVKRQKQTIFLYTEPTETIKVVLDKIAAINKDDASAIRLQSESGDVFDASSTVGDNNLANDQIVHLIQKNDDDSWETPDIHAPEPEGIKKAEGGEASSSDASK
jgi:hypothetical protein